MSLLVTRMVTGPTLMVLKMEMASECDIPCTDIPLTERISSPEANKILFRSQIIDIHVSLICIFSWVLFMNH